MPVMLLLLLPLPLMPAPMSRNEEFPFSPLLFSFLQWIRDKYPRIRFAYLVAQFRGNYDSPFGISLIYPVRAFSSRLLYSSLVFSPLASRRVGDQRIKAYLRAKLDERGNSPVPCIARNCHPDKKGTIAPLMSDAMR